MNSTKPLYFRRRFPSEIISHCVWLYFRFSLSYRDIEEMMAKRGVIVSYETIRDWSHKFGGIYAKRLRARSTRPNDHWHLDEVYLSINGKAHYLWHAVDQDGEILDILVQPRRNKYAAKKFFRKLLKKLHYIPRVIITDKLRSYAAAKAEIMPEVKHVQDKGANIRAENSHQPTRERERRMRGFKSARHAQRFLASYSVIGSFFCPGRHVLAAKNYREIMRQRFIQWNEIVSFGFTFQ
ncbi:IS6 family transposase [Solimicrobium silvestre]|uniref:Transposase n=1 Tax=Solimicrobium silvestre TaxID=2099400 RepID=A0A2S9GXD0_9BURK|nr:IS6 family transposase [Solimicrobium silvestre]PRC92377.1 Transposase [Solimicrobium silvestre]